MTNSNPTVEEIRDDLICYIWDAYKDLNGFRPRNIYDFSAMSVEELQEECDRLSAQIAEEIEAEKAQKQADREEREWLRFHYIIGSE